MAKGWSKGLTKDTDDSIRKRSETMRRKHIDNFKKWRSERKKLGLGPIYKKLKKDGDLAELIGVILGDGHIRTFPRTEELSIFSNSNNPGFVKRYAGLVEKLFGKKPALTKHSGKNCIRIRIYQKNIAERLDLPYSPRGKLKIKIHPWILENTEFIVRYLRGLYEAEGAHCVHEPTCTYKLFFANRNTSMLENVTLLLKKLGFHPHGGKFQVQVSKRKEVSDLVQLLEFRKY